MKIRTHSLITPLCTAIASLVIIGSPARAGYIVTLTQAGPNVVANGSGAIDLTGLQFPIGFGVSPGLAPNSAYIFTGRPGNLAVAYSGARFTGPRTIGSGFLTNATSGSGDLVGLFFDSNSRRYSLSVPPGYISGTALSDTATYDNATFSSLGVTPGTYEWTWGTGTNQNFTLQIGPPTPRPASQAHLLNISTRMDVKTGDKVLIGGFIVTGNAPKKVILRAIGPSLAPALAGVLANPVLELHAANGDLITSNDNWKDTQQTEIEATGIPPQNDLESAIVATLNPGAYTAILSGKGGTSGIGLVEGYDLDQPAAAQLANISTRGFVEAGSNVMIGGFILGNGTGTTNVVLRALGPSLPVAGALANPTLELHDANGELVQNNDNWMDNSPADQAELTANQLAPTNDLESAIIVTLPRGAFTAIVAGKNGARGVGLVEAYRLP